MSKPPLDWQSKKQWRSDVIKSTSKKELFFLLFSLFFISPVIFLVPELQKNLYSGNYIPIIAGSLFPIIGICVFAIALRRFLSNYRFGRVEFKMNPYPGCIGGHVGGEIFIEKWPFDAFANNPKSVKVKLECIHSYITNSNGKSSRTETIDWSQNTTIDVSTSFETNKQAQLNFYFEVPKNTSQSDVKRSGSYHRWVVTLEADVPGVNLVRRFDIPVFNGNEQAPSRYENLSKAVEAIKNIQSVEKKTNIEMENFSETALVKNMKFSKNDQSIQFYFGMFRGLAISAFALVFSVGFSIPLISIVSSFTLDGFSVFSLIFTIPFTLVSIIASVIVLYLPFNTLKTVVDAQSVNVQRCWMFIPFFNKQLSSKDVTHLSLKTGMTVGSGANRVIHYDLIAHSDIQTVTLLLNIKDEDLANYVKEYVEKKMNLKNI